MSTVTRICFIILSLAFIMSSCDDDDISNGPDLSSHIVIPGYVQAVQTIKSSVVGHVTDEFNQNIEGATVTLDGKRTTTNKYGHFFFTDADMNKEGTFVQVEQDGFFHGSRRFYPLAEHTSNLEIQLLAKVFNNTFQSSQGAYIEFEDGGSVEFPVNAIIDENNVLYDGEVYVAAKWLAPTSLATSRRMPGDLTGVNDLAEEVSLATFGMMAVELESSDGRQLNVAENSEAILTFPITSEIISAAPAEIPLWYFNERYGIWAQDGMATLQGNEYVGSVNHFTFWNCDAPYELINLDFKLVDEDGLALTNRRVGITLGGVVTRNAYTDDMGYVSGKVPANENLTLKVFTNCYATFSENIGSFAADASIGSVDVPNSLEIATNTISVSLVNCESKPIVNGLIIAQIEDRLLYFYTSDIATTLAFTFCESVRNISLKALDLDNPTHFAVANVSPDEVAVDLGEMKVCDAFVAPENTILVEVNGSYHAFPINMIQVADLENYTQISTYLEDFLGPRCSIRFEGLSTGNHDHQETYIRNTALGWNILTEDEGLKYTVTEFGANPGDKIIGSCEGVMNNRFSSFQAFVDPIPVNVRIAFNATRE